MDAMPSELNLPEPTLPDSNLDLGYGVHPNVEDYDLPGNGGGTTYTVSPIIEDIKNPPVSDLTYTVSPLVQEFNPSGYDDYDTPEGNGEPQNPPPEVYADAGTGDGTGGSSGAAQFTFAPEVSIPITVEGSVDEQTIERLRAQLRDELNATMRSLFEEFRQEELDLMALKNQYAF